MNKNLIIVLIVALYFLGCRRKRIFETGILSRN